MVVLSQNTKKEAEHKARPLICVLSLVDSPNYFFARPNAAAASAAVVGAE